MVEGKRVGLTRIDEVILGENGENVLAKQRGISDVYDRYADVNTMTALNQPIARSSEQLVKVNQELSQQVVLAELQQQQRQTQERSQGRSL